MLAVLVRGDLLVLLPLAVACSSTSHTASMDGGGGAPGTGGRGSVHVSRDAQGTVSPPPRTYAPTYDAVWNEILHPTCAGEYCHGGAGLFLELSSKDRGYETLVNFPTMGVDCKATGLMHVEPGHPERSMVYLKVTNPPCGMHMPPPISGIQPLDDRSIEQLGRWIARGAPNDSVWDGGGATGWDASADAASDGSLSSDAADTLRDGASSD